MYHLKRNNNKINCDMSSKIMEARKQWNNIFKIENDDADQPRILYQQA